MDRTETFAQLINGQFFVVYLSYDRRGRPRYEYKLDGVFIPCGEWIAAKTTAEAGA